MCNLVFIFYLKNDNRPEIDLSIFDCFSLILRSILYLHVFYLPHELHPPVFAFALSTIPLFIV